MTLHKLQEGFIVTSDEHRKIGDSIYDFKDNVFRTCKISHFPNGEEVKDRWGKKVIAQQDQIDFSALTEEEQKEIGWFDVEQWAWDNACLSRKDVHKLFEKIFKEKKLEGKYTISAAKQVHSFNVELRSLSKQKAQELLTSDKRFTLEDMRKAFEKGIKFEQSDSKDAYKDYSYNKDVMFDDYIQSLSQPKSWQIEGEWVDDKFKITKITL